MECARTAEVPVCAQPLETSANDSGRKFTHHATEGSPPKVCFIAPSRVALRHRSIHGTQPGIIRCRGFLRFKVQGRPSRILDEHGQWGDGGEADS